MKNIKTSLTIGIPAHNEGRNIQVLLDSIIRQKQTNFKFEKIYVACDGCTDNTAEVVKKYSKKYKFIICIDDGKRLGKIERLNKFYQLSKSKIYLTLDADVVLGNGYVIEEIIKKFQNPKVGLVGGFNIPSDPRNFFETIVITWISIWNETRKQLENSESVHNHLGCVSAMSNNLYKQIIIPKSIISDDDYLFFKAKTLGFKFAFAKNSIVYYQTVTNPKEFFTQHTRLLNLKNLIANHFGELVYQDYKVPVSIKIKSLIIIFLKNPVFFILAIFFQIVLRISNRYGLFRENYQNGLWTPAISSKSLIKIKGDRK